MTAQQMSVVLGTKVLVAFEQVAIECTVTDVKQAYGKTRYEIEPLAGMGRQWVELNRVRTNVA